MANPKGRDWTTDQPAEGLAVTQPRRGFRYGSEAFWLVGFALDGAPPPESAVDLGTGSGIMALLLGRSGVSVTGVDLRREWEPLWRRSLGGSNLAGSVDLRVHDVGQGPPVTGVDLVVSNPPFFAAGTGPASEDAWKRAARTESTATLARFVEVAVGCVGSEGRACWVVPRERWSEVTHRDASVSRVVHVGKRRSLVELRVGGPRRAVEEKVVSDRGPVVRRWYALATGASTPDRAKKT